MALLQQYYQFYGDFLKDFVNQKKWLPVYKERITRKEERDMKEGHVLFWLDEYPDEFKCFRAYLAAAEEDKSFWKSEIDKFLVPK